MKWASRFREPSAKTEQIIAGNTNAILMELEVTNHIMIPSRSEKEHLNRVWEMQFMKPSADTANQIAYLWNQNWKFEKHWFAQS